MAPSPTSISPELADEALACCVLFALNNCHGKRDAFKHKGDGISQFQLSVAADVVSLYGINVDDSILPGLCEWMRLRRQSPPPAWLEVLKWQTKPRVCSHCWTPGKLCQLPGTYRTDPAKREPGFCLIRNISAALRNPIMPGVYALGPYDKPTDWPLLDQVMWKEGFGAWSIPHNEPYRQRTLDERFPRA